MQFEAGGAERRELELIGHNDRSQQAELPVYSLLSSCDPIPPWSTDEAEMRRAQRRAAVQHRGQSKGIRRAASGTPMDCARVASAGGGVRHSVPRVCVSVRRVQWSLRPRSVPRCSVSPPESRVTHRRGVPWRHCDRLAHVATRWLHRAVRCASAVRIAQRRHTHRGRRDTTAIRGGTDGTTMQGRRRTRPTAPHQGSTSYGQ